MTPISYPIARLARVYIGSERCGWPSMPRDSEGNSAPVGVPKPKSRSVSYCSSGASLEAELRHRDVAGDLNGLGEGEVSLGWVTVRDPAGPGARDRHEPEAAFGEYRLGVAHPIPHEQRGGREELRGRARLERVGERRSPLGPRRSPASRRAPAAHRGSGSRNTTSPPSDRVSLRASSRPRSAISCSSASSVSTTSLPGTGSRTSRAGESYRRPARSFNRTAAPARPVRMESSDSSRPAPPTGRSAERPPMIGRASSRDG